MQGGKRPVLGPRWLAKELTLEITTFLQEKRQGATGLKVQNGEMRTSMSQVAHMTSKLCGPGNHHRYWLRMFGVRGSHRDSFQTRDME